MDGFFFLGVLLILYILIMPIILLNRLGNCFRKIEEELEQVKLQLRNSLKKPGASPDNATLPQEEYQCNNAKEKEEVSRIGNILLEEYPEEEQVAEVENEVIEKLEKEPTFEEESVLEEIQRPAPIIPKKPKRKINYEKFIGENLFGKIGILVFVIGIGLFVKYAIDKDWINETLRTVLGFLAGSALLATAGRLQKKYRTFSSLLAGGAFGVFYLTVAIAFHYYHLFSQTSAFLILIAITILMPILAILYDRRELAIISLIGGFLAPFIVSSGEGNYMVLFTYLSILNIGMFCLSIYKKWSELPILSYVFTSVIMAGYIENCTSEEFPPTVAGILFLFCTLFYLIFLLPTISILHSASTKTNRLLLSVIISNNFTFLGFGIFLLGCMALPFEAEGLLSLFIAIINLALVIWLRKSKQDYLLLIYAMLGLVLTFVSITVPLQLSGNYITLFWASEMVLLLWLYAKSRIWVYEYATLILVCLTLISFVMDVFHSIVYSSSHLENIFINSQFATSLFMGLATGAFAWLMSRQRTSLEGARFLKYSPWNALMSVFSILILYYTFMREFSLHLPSGTNAEVMMLFTSGCITAYCYGFRKRFPISRYAGIYQLLTGSNTLLFVIFAYAHYSELTGTNPLLAWVNVLFIIANLYDVSRQYYKANGMQPRYTIYLNIVSTLFWVYILQLLFLQTGLNDLTAAFSIALISAGFVQMGLGMKLHQKVLRIISLVTFGIVLLKLVLIDLWAMPTVGKIIVFIILGLILLVLSFLYQKLKNVLFKDDENEAN
ncbi:DUF2339 domain-containing protein [Bacteroides sp.]|uniref:DUF2339 domain-containing protein n=1 Tax=Bacteroides sp. TaxID=29523 RepID=UPI00260588EC|nr:DUF2339 domain-containing protein [Bacteroides sp.]